MNNIQHIYANGCSFTFDNYIQLELNELCYPEILAKNLGIGCTNAAQPGSCNRRIIRNTLRDSLSFDSTTLVLVQLTFISRTEKPVLEEIQSTNEEYHESIKGTEADVFSQKYFKTFMQFFNSKAEFTNLAADIIMLTGYLQSKNIPYLVFPYVQLNTQPSLSISNDRLQQALAKDSNVLNILFDSLCKRLGPGEWYYDSAHLDGNGHHRAAEILQDLLSNQFS